MTRNFKRFLLLALVLVPMFFLASCKPNANPEKAADALEDKDYAVSLIDDEAMLKGSPMDGLKAILTALNEEEEEAIMIYYFDSAKDAKEAWEDFEDLFEEMKEEAEETDKEVVVKRSGKMIYVGTKQAVKDAR